MAQVLFGESQESLDANKKIQLSKLAILSGMLPMAKHGAKGPFVHFSNGVQNVYISNKPIDKESVVMGLINVIKANGLDSRAITLYQNGQLDEIGACDMVGKQVEESYKSAKIEPRANGQEHFNSSANLRLMRMASANLNQHSLQTMLYVVEKNNREFVKVSKEVGFSKAIPAFVSKYVEDSLQDINRELLDRKVNIAIEKEMGLNSK